MLEAGLRASQETHASANRSRQVRLDIVDAAVDKELKRLVRLVVSLADVVADCETHSAIVGKMREIEQLITR
jgi:hypothetical protein